MHFRYLLITRWYIKILLSLVDKTEIREIFATPQVQKCGSLPQDAGDLVGLRSKSHDDVLILL